MKILSLPPTVNLHTLIPCNYSCGFCYAGFAASKRSRIPQPELHEIIRQIAVLPQKAGIGARKVTFAGGEPLLSPTILDDVAFARTQGLVTSLVTNGSLLSEQIIRCLAPILDWLTISIDSLNADTNRRIGRAVRGIPLSSDDYLAKIQRAQDFGIRVKLNTVVNQANTDEDFNTFIRIARPLRWKLIQATKIIGENDKDFDRWGIDQNQFHNFVARHVGLVGEGIVLVPEKQTDVYGTYAMVGPNGCFFDNSKRTCRYSRPIVAVGLENAWAEISFSAEGFSARNGDYDFTTGLNRKEPAL
jgi:radical S-adenosyl methionine domain-containing protein 2